MNPRFASPRLALFLSSAALAAAAGCSGAPRTTTAAPFADGALVDYLPPDAGAVYSIDQRRLLDSPAGRRLAVPLQQFADRLRAEHPWMDCLGAGPLRAADRTELVFCPPDFRAP